MLYTRAGDNGTTRLFSCEERIVKNDARIEALGNLDELNSYLGLCATQIHGEVFREFQHDIFTIQAQLAGADYVLPHKRVVALEVCVATCEKELPMQRTFVVPGGTQEAAHIDIARAVARRAERSVVALCDSRLACAVTYLNRLSSALYALARVAVIRGQVAEMPPQYRV